MRLRTVDWAREQLGFTSLNGAYVWLKRNRIPVHNKRISEEAFYSAFARREPESPKPVRKFG